MKKINKLPIILISSFLLVACGNSSNGSTSGGESIGTSNSEISSNSNSTTTSGGEEVSFLNKSYKVETQGSAWDGVMNKSAQILGDGIGNYAKAQEAFINYLNSDNGVDTGLVSSISGESVNNTKYKDGGTVNALMLGNGKSSMGELTLNFSLPISKIEVEVESYSKPYSYGDVSSKNADKYSVLAIGTKENQKMKVLDMSLETNGEDNLPLISTASLEFVKGTRSVTFKGIGDENFESDFFEPGRIAFHHIYFSY